VADFIKKKLSIEVELKEGRLGEFTVLVNDKVVARKWLFRFPPDDKVLLAVRAVSANIDSATS